MKKLETAVETVAVEESSEEGSDTALGHAYVPGCTQQEHLVTSQLPFALVEF